MSAAGRFHSDDSSNDRFELGHFNRDAQSPSEERNRLLLARLTEETASLRAATRMLGDRVEHLARLAANRRAN